MAHPKPGTCRVCPLCWKDPSNPPFPHSRSGKNKGPIPMKKDELISAISKLAPTENDLHKYTVHELRHIYSVETGRKVHPACPLVGVASMHKDEIMKLCQDHGVVLGEGKHKKGEYQLELRRHWESQCDIADQLEIQKSGMVHLAPPCSTWSLPSEAGSDPWNVIPEDDDQSQGPPLFTSLDWLTKCSRSQHSCPRHVGLAICGCSHFNWP